jgi:hypothetical protein
MNTEPQYEHTQKGQIHRILYGAALGLLVVARLCREDQPAMTLVCFPACLMVLAGLCFETLTVRDEGEHLAVRFGPLRVFRSRIPYAKIAAAEPARSSVIDGWGIHWMPGKGWIYNLWGFDCVKITLGRKTVRIGTDDPQGLAEFLKTKIAADPSSP